MQWNCTSPYLPNIGYDPFSVNKAPTYPQIIGEGDVTSVIFPDGTIQLYFVPTNRHVTLSPFQFNTNIPNLHCTANKDIWFVRSISHPLPPSLINRPFPNVYGDQQTPPQFNPNFCINSPPCPDYHQKFHNDDSTSTTDIHYFYPSLRYNGRLKYSAEVQTEPFFTNVLGGCQGHCDCKSAVTVVKKNLNTKGDASASSTSHMSVDSASKSKLRIPKKNKKKSRYKSNKNRDHSSDLDLETKKSKYISNKSRDHSCDCDVETKKSKYKSNKSGDHRCNCDVETKKSKYKSNTSREYSCDCDLETKKSKYESKDTLCECNVEIKNTSDKLVTTYAEKASGATVKDGRHTQTLNNTSRRSDITTELWLPIDCKSNSTLKLETCDNSDQCCCKSNSETDD